MQEIILDTIGNFPYPLGRWHYACNNNCKFLIVGSTNIQGECELRFYGESGEIGHTDIRITENESYDITSLIHRYHNNDKTFNELEIRSIGIYNYWFDWGYDFIMIYDKYKMYKCYLNYDKSIPTLKNLIGVTSQFNNKYPYIVKNSSQNYYTGTISAIFVEEDEDFEWGYDFENAVQYRNDLKQWLYNGQPKILTLMNGDQYIIGISGNINEKLENNFDNLITSFNWYQIAEYNLDNLYNYGFRNNAEGQNIIDWYGEEPPTDDSLLQMQLVKLLKGQRRDDSDIINLVDNQIINLRDQAFAESPTIISVKMNALQSIGNYSFQYCEMLQEAIFPQVTSIGNNAFNGCTNLYNLVLKSSSVSTLGENALYNTPIANSTITSACIYVPDNLRTQYKNASGWSTYSAKIKAIEGSVYDG